MQEEIRLFTPSNMLTITNLLCGVIAIILYHDSVIAAALILLAMVFDALDGLVARLTNTASSIGRELDSLADLVSFGVAPMVVFYYSMNTNGGIESILKIIAIILYVSFAALRLARFNIQSSIKFFEGTPVTSQALLVLTAVFLLDDIEMALLIMILSPLMISTIRYPNFKTKEGFKVILLLAVLSVLLSTIIMVILNTEIFRAIFLYGFVGILTYIIMGPIVFYLLSRKNF